MMNSFLKKTSWMALAVALLIGGSIVSNAATKSDDSSSGKDSVAAANKKADQKLKQEIAKKLKKRLETDMKADALTLKVCPNCQAKYILTRPGIGQVGTLSYEKREDLRGGAQCQEEVYKALKKEGGKFHPCVGEPRFDPANMATGIYNVDADIDVEHDNEYSVMDLTRTCAMMGKDGSSGSKAGQECCNAWDSIVDQLHARPIKYWTGTEYTTELVMDKLCCNLTKREEVKDGETPISLNEEALCQTEPEEKAECMNGAMSGGSSAAVAWEQCDVECSNGKQFADLFHDEEGVDSSKNEEERKKEIDQAIQKCYKNEDWSPSPTCLTASELAPVMPTSIAGIVNKKLSDSDKGTGKKLKSVNSQVLKTMTVTASGTANANKGSEDTTGRKGRKGTVNDEKAYENNINSVRENQNKIKVNAASRAVALGKRAVWLATTAGDEIDQFSKKLEMSDDFMRMFKSMAELQAQHLQKTTQNTALRAKLSELSSIDGVISSNVITAHESDIETDEETSGEE